jgi:hypothetical protein
MLFGLSMGRKFAAPPIPGSDTTFLPLQAADLIAGVMKDELERRLYTPTEGIRDSFYRIQEMAKETMRKETLHPRVPFFFGETDEDIQWHIKMEPPVWRTGE